jgi:uncharacterized protein YkwD
MLFYRFIRMKQIILILFLIPFTFVNNCYSQKNSTKSGRTQEFIDEINLVRTQPDTYIKFIPDFLDYFNSCVDERSDADELMEELKHLKPMRELQHSAELYKLAKSHCEWMAKTGKFKHSRYNYAENIQYGNSNVRYAVIDLLIDYGVPGREHRKNLLNPNFSSIGVYEIINSSKEMDYIVVQIFQ